jgi:DNA-binding response OmpR family regulator
MDETIDNKTKNVILIVDDEQALLKALTQKLVNEGYEVLVAKNGKEGLEISLSKKPDLIMLDLLMPVMDGKEMIKKLREDEWGATVPVVIMSNVTDTQSIYDMISTGTSQRPNDYLVKSDTSLESIIEILKSHLSNN